MVVAWCRWRVVPVFGSRVSGLPGVGCGSVLNRSIYESGAPGAFLVWAGSDVGGWRSQVVVGGSAGQREAQGMSDRRRSGLLRPYFRRRFAGVLGGGAVVGWSGLMRGLCFGVGSEFFENDRGSVMGVCRRG